MLLSASAALPVPLHAFQLKQLEKKKCIQYKVKVKSNTSEKNPPPKKIRSYTWSRVVEIIIFKGINMEVLLQGFITEAKTVTHCQSTHSYHSTACLQSDVILLFLDEFITWRSCVTFWLQTWTLTGPKPGLCGPQCGTEVWQRTQTKASSLLQPNFQQNQKWKHFQRFIQVSEFIKNLRFRVRTFGSEEKKCQKTSVRIY